MALSNAQHPGLTGTPDRESSTEKAILRSLLDNSDERVQAVAERILTTAALARLQLEPVRGSFDLEHLSAIHRTVFAQTRADAGAIRTQPLERGASILTAPEGIPSAVASTLAPIHEKDNLRHSTADEFKKATVGAAIVLAELQPFAHGTGIVVNEFLRTLGLNAGYELSYKKALEAERSPALSLTTTVNQALVRTTPSLAIQQRYDQREETRALSR